MINVLIFNLKTLIEGVSTGWGDDDLDYDSENPFHGNTRCIYIG
jgi:hypothetical protein